MSTNIHIPWLAKTERTSESHELKELCNSRDILALCAEYGVMTDIREDFIPWDIRYLRTRSYRRKSLIKKRLQVPCQVSHLYSVFNFSTLRKSPWGQLSYINELKTYSLHKHDAIDIANPSSMQGACHLNFVIDLAHRTLCGSIVESWNAESEDREDLRFGRSEIRFLIGTLNFFFVPRSWQDEKKSFSISYIIW